VSLETYGGLFDTVSVCLSKGLGAPVGSVLVSSAERIAEARVWRKRLGAGCARWRARGGRALRARAPCRPARRGSCARTPLAEAVAEVAPEAVDPARVQTNIVVLDVPDAAALAAACASEGVRISVLGPRVARLVTHLDVDDADVQHAAKVLTDVLAADDRH
jgi:threonine aldolase